MNKDKKLIIFDLDGVLIDSLPNMRAALKKTSLSMNIKLKFSEYKKYLGLPFEKIMHKMHIKNDIKKIKSNYSYYSKKNIKNIKIKKTHVKQLNYLKKDYCLSVFTSKDKIRTKAILNKYKFFNFIVTSDDVVKGKPYPEGIFKILKKNKVSKKNCIYIGDSIYDYLAAKKAGVNYLHAKWGYEKKLNKIYKITKISNFLEISKYF
jgi:HAD superfamily hydrolase (TIGR01549 family)|tara:strand:+ start:44 stop:661 length:618 start_codon:yes stop_codon:yes gene_type:complete